MKPDAVTRKRLPAGTAGYSIRDVQKAMLNLLEDVSYDKTLMEDSQRATLNILEDFTDDKSLLEDSQRATLNILEDFTDDKSLLEDSQRATLNILEDFTHDKSLLEQSQKAMLNILEDSTSDKGILEETQTAVLNILEDYNNEKETIEKINTELKLSKETLENRVEERTKELKSTNEELESFSYSVSHDLRAPLRSIVGYCNILEEEYSGIVDDDGKRIIAIIVRNALRMGRLIDDILEFSRLGRQRLRIQKIPLTDLFKEIYGEISTQLEQQRDIDFRISELGVVTGDKIMLGQLITNLVSNAIKYTGKKEKAMIEVGRKIIHDNPVYFVKDNGVGFKQEYADKVFGVFQRLHKAKDFEGTGVGLAIAQRIISHHGGRIWAEGEPDKGCTIYFTIKELHEEEPENDGTC